jgi:septal ring factor EnvC (AmiA/AmiB activator)
MRMCLYTTAVRSSGRLWLIGVALAASALHAQDRLPSPSASSINERIRALEREASDLARQARTLVGELRTLQVQRDLRIEEARVAQTAATEARQALQQATERIAALEQQRVDQLPDLKAQLVSMYKNGRGGFARLLLDAKGVREFARTARAVSAVATINERRIREHRNTINALAQERDGLERKTAELQTRESAAQRARTAAERAVADHARLIEQIDSRRDLTAQYVGELQQAYERLQEQELRASAAPAAVPLTPFRGPLPWPVAGSVRARFGQAEGRLGGTAVRNGMEISADEGTSVRAVHAGTVTFADTFTGFGTLVIVDHGANNYSLYGYLGALSVQRGDVIDSGAELGRVGLAPAGPAALYFEMRVDGRSVDPLQWLQPR